MFSKLIKKVDTDNYTELIIDSSQIKAQYNPDRFKFWRSLHKGPREEVLNMLYSPHYRLLSGDDSAYYKMQKLYGRNDKWIKNKINNFTNLLDNIRMNGYNDAIIVLNKPLVKNKYNNGFELFEGHHRLACGLILNIEKIQCRVIGENNENN